MTNQAGTGQLAGLPVDPAAVVAEDRGRAAARGIFEAIWDLLTSMRFSLVVLLAMAVLGVVGAMVIQEPAGVANDPAAKADWLAGVRPRYGGWTDIMDRLQLFSVFGSYWFRGLTAFLTISLIACMIQRAPGLWRTATKPRVTVGDGFFAHARERDSIVVRGDVDDLTARAAGVFRKHHYRVLVEDDGAVNFFADRFRFAPFGSLFGHLSIVLILAGAIVGSLMGFRDNAFVIAEGSTIPVPSGDGLSVKLVSFEDAYYTDTGAPADYASDLIVYKDGAQVARHTARVNDPMRLGDLSFYQSFYGPAAIMSVTDADGTTLFSEGVPLAWKTNDDNRSVGSFTVPSKDLTVWVVATYGGGDPLVKPGQIRLETYRASTGDPIGQQTIDQGVPTAVSGVTFTFDREIQFTGLSVARDPGTILVWIGSFLLIAGFTIGFSFPHRRVWGRLTMRPNGVGTLNVATPGRVTHDVDRAFTHLVTDLRAACAASTAS
ncbi:MAG TPA: cytochrome c biogenesis protein ResB [Candidatus Sulfomarinibacteraceae bacterium]|nr:cytochrome c biogenesis protein ResB [Candidatus Sulfomarinibacteraceae bacterium]